MDRKSSQLTALLLGLGLAATTAIAQERSQLREEAWLSESGRLEALSSEPAVFAEDLIREIERLPSGAEIRGSTDWKEQLRLGSLLFKTPYLFGGQAAKTGLSCHSCHVNGRANPHFQFPGVSGEPGTADITHSFFSESLGNDLFDPVLIPDLTQAGEVDHSLGSSELDAFIRNIVVNEFAGEEPGVYALASLSTYTRALAVVGGLGENALIDRCIARDLDEIQSMVEQARDLLAEQPQSDHRLSRLLLAGSRHRLALVHERLVDTAHTPHRLTLEQHSRALGSVQNRLSSAEIDPTSASVALSEWIDGFADRAEFEALQSESLYDRERLRRYLELRD